MSENLLKAKSYCECGTDGCGVFGTLGKPDRNGKRHVKGCPCRVCSGRWNKRNGHAKQRVARKALGVAPRKYGDTHEETWADLHFANEVKSGKQCGPVANWWLRVEGQVLANEADHGDRRRPVRAVAMPEDWGSDGLVVVRLSTWRDQIGPALDEYYGSVS